VSDSIRMPSVSGPPEPMVHIPSFLRPVVTTVIGLAVAAAAFPVVTGMFFGCRGASRSARVQLRNRESQIEKAIQSQDGEDDMELHDER